jgi:putative hemolysin
MPFAFELITIFVMLIFNAFFASYEMALASISRSRLAVLLSQKKKGAEAAVFMKDRMEASLAVIQLGITLVGAIAAATGGAGIEESLSPVFENKFGFTETWAEVVSLICLIIPLSCFTIIFGELIPKVFALQNQERVCLGLSPVMKVLSFVVYPVVNLFEGIVKKIIAFGSKKMDLQKPEEQGLHELRAAVSLARSSKLIGAHEEKIVLSASNLAIRPVSSAMIPASDIAMISVSCSLDEAFVKAHMDMHTRFPVCEKENDPQTIIGYVNFKDIILALKVNPSDPSIRGITRPLKSFAVKTPISQVLSQMMQEKIHIALVRSNENKIEGFITLEDILEELVGEIEDEFDRMPTHIHPYGTSWIMGGGVPMHLVAEKMGKDLKLIQSEAVSLTLNDWCSQKLGRVPQGADIIEQDGIRVTIRKIRRKKVAEAILSS